MKLKRGLHLAYCTNIHRGESWAETFESLKNYTLAVQQKVCPHAPYGIGLRLSHRAARELSEPAVLLAFQQWLGQNHCYVFTINGFPYGRFHGKGVKERVYEPDWTSPERLAYTNLLFDLLEQLLPEGVEGSVSTLPGSFKEFIHSPDQAKAIRDHLWHCVEHVARLSEQTGRMLHLGLEPEPLCFLECTGETIRFFDRLRAEHHGDPRLREHLGVNYDTCHFAVEFEEPQNALACLQQHGIKISKLHLSSALKVRPSAEARQALAAFADDVYLHQVVVRRADGQRVIYRDLDDALVTEEVEAETSVPSDSEWRIHFHIPLHSPPTNIFDTTTDHTLGALDFLQFSPGLCSHLEMETYTWEVLPPALKNRDVVDQLAAEYEWTLSQLAGRDLVAARP